MKKLMNKNKIQNYFNLFLNYLEIDDKDKVEKNKEELINILFEEQEKLLITHEEMKKNRISFEQMFTTMSYLEAIRTKKNVVIITNENHIHKVIYYDNDNELKEEIKSFENSNFKIYSSDFLYDSQDVTILSLYDIKEKYKGNFYEFESNDLLDYITILVSLRTENSTTGVGSIITKYDDQLETEVIITDGYNAIHKDMNQYIDQLYKNNEIDDKKEFMNFIKLICYATQFVDKNKYPDYENSILFYSIREGFIEHAERNAIHNLNYYYDQDNLTNLNMRVTLDCCTDCINKICETHQNKKINFKNIIALETTGNIKEREKIIQGVKNNAGYTLKLNHDSPILNDNNIKYWNSSQYQKHISLKEFNLNVELAIFCDIDDVILKTYEKFVDYINKTYLYDYPELHLTKENAEFYYNINNYPEKYLYIEEIMHIVKEKNKNIHQYYDLVHEFFINDNHYQDIEHYDVNKLTDYLNNNKNYIKYFHFVSSSFPEHIKNKNKRIKEIFKDQLDYQQYGAITHSSHKGLFARNTEKTSSILIDDKLDNIINFLEKNEVHNYGILIKQPWNFQDKILDFTNTIENFSDRIIIIDSLDDIAQAVDKIIQKEKKRKKDIYLIDIQQINIINNINSLFNNLHKDLEKMPESLKEKIKQLNQDVKKLTDFTTSLDK